MHHDIALNRLSMTYSWYNISDSYKNNKIKYSTDSGNSWETIDFVDGMYSYSDLDDYIHQYMDNKKHSSEDKKGENVYHININFIESSFKVLISVDNNYQLDLRGTKFGDLIGFDEKIITQTEYGSRLPNITNSIDVLNINSDVISDSIVNGVNTNTIAIIPTDNLTRSYPFTFEPKRTLFNPVSSNNISDMRFYVTDALYRPVNLNNIDWLITLILRSIKM